MFKQLHCAVANLTASAVLGTLVVLLAWLVPFPNNEESLSTASMSERAAQVSASVRYYPQYVLVAVVHVFNDYSFMLFSAVPWPRSFWVSLVSCFVCVGCYMSTLFSWQTSEDTPFGLLLICLGEVYVFFFASATNKERRRDFAFSLQLARELGYASAEKTANEGLISALFPQSVAERLMQSVKVSPRNARNSTLVSSLSSSTSSSLYAGSDVALSSLKGDCFGNALFGETFASASIVFAMVDGIEDLHPFDTQLKTLSEIFIAADNIAEKHHVVKIKSISTSLLFACGLPTSTEAHTTKACELAEELMRMMQQFCRDRAVENTLSLRIGIASGQVIAGVIGKSRPRYDVWGYTVSVAEKLMRAAPKWTIYVTREIASAAKHAFKFKKTKGTTVVEGLGKLVIFRLELIDTGSPYVIKCAQTELLFLACSHTAPFCVLASCTPVKLVMPSVKPVALADVSLGKQSQFNLSSKINNFSLRFLKHGRESVYLTAHSTKFVFNIRWFSFVAGISYVLYAVIAFINGHWTIARWVANPLLCVSVLGMFAVTFIKPLVARPRLFWNIEAAIAFVSVILVAVLFDTSAWYDPILAGMLAEMFFLTASRIRFAIVALFNIVLILATIYMYTNLGYGRGTAVLHLTAAWVICFSHYDFERQSRRVFLVGRKLSKAKRATLAEKEKTKALLTSVVPEKVIDKLVHATTANAATGDDFYLTEFIASGTVLVCKIVGFNEIYKCLPPSDVVRLLNALFSHFDVLARDRGLEPLKTIGALPLLSAFLLPNLTPIKLGGNKPTSILSWATC